MMIAVVVGGVKIRKGKEDTPKDHDGNEDKGKKAKPAGGHAEAEAAAPATAPLGAALAAANVNGSENTNTAAAGILGERKQNLPSIQSANNKKKKVAPTTDSDDVDNIENQQGQQLQQQSAAGEQQAGPVLTTGNRSRSGGNSRNVPGSWAATAAANREEEDEAASVTRPINRGRSIEEGIAALLERNRMIEEAFRQAQREREAAARASSSNPRAYAGFDGVADVDVEGGRVVPASASAVSAVPRSKIRDLLSAAWRRNRRDDVHAAGYDSAVVRGARGGLTPRGPVVSTTNPRSSAIMPVPADMAVEDIHVDIFEGQVDDMTRALRYDAEKWAKIRKLFYFTLGVAVTVYMIVVLKNWSDFHANARNHGDQLLQQLSEDAEPQLLTATSGNEITN